MKSVTWMYILAVILIVMSACGLGIGGFIALGRAGGANVSASMTAIPILLGILGGLAGIALIFTAVRKTRSDAAQNVTLKVDLPGDVNVEKMKCQSCGGVLTADDIKVVNGAPMVTCPFCKTVYQLTEEPKW